MSACALRVDGGVFGPSFFHAFGQQLAHQHENKRTPAHHDRTHYCVGQPNVSGCLRVEGNSVYGQFAP